MTSSVLGAPFYAQTPCIEGLYSTDVSSILRKFDAASATYRAVQLSVISYQLSVISYQKAEGRRQKAERAMDGVPYLIDTCTAGELFLGVVHLLQKLPLSYTGEPVPVRSKRAICGQYFCEFF